MKLLKNCVLKYDCGLAFNSYVITRNYFFKSHPNAESMLRASNVSLSIYATFLTTSKCQIHSNLFILITLLHYLKVFDSLLHSWQIWIGQSILCKEGINFVPSCFDKIVTWEGAPRKKISQSLDSAYSSVARYFISKWFEPRSYFPSRLK